MEQPEDLGRTQKERIPGHRPGSMWQFPQHEELLAMEGVQSVALAQLDFGSASVKPTCLLLRAPGPLHPEMYEGLPQLDENGWYCGPLPKKQGEPLIGRSGGIFKTASAAAWPPALCEWVATQIMASFRLNSGFEGMGQKMDQMTGQQGRSTKRSREEAAEEEVTDPFDPPAKGGQGKPRCCTWKGNLVPFHDVGCLMSPGRWEIGKRSFPDSTERKRLRATLRRVITSAAGSEALLERECFAMAGGANGCRLVQDAHLREKILGLLAEFCQVKGNKEKPLEVAVGQPFRLGLMRAILEIAGDADCEFLREAEDGLPLGVKHPLPRTPMAFERQVEWALDYDPMVASIVEKANYPSAAEHEAHVRGHLEEEVREGLVDKCCGRTLRRSLGVRERWPRWRY